MTIQQHASFDSSAAELNATSKLVKAWESKNARNAAKAGGVSLMALSLAACGGSSTPAPDAGGDAGGDAGSPSPQTYTLTAGIDTITGTAAADTINAGLNANSTQTLQSLDTINGGGGTDTINVILNAAGTYTPQLTSVEAMHVTSSANVTIDFLGGASVVDIVSTGATGTVALNNIATTATEITVKNTDQNHTVDYIASAVSGTADAATIGLYNVTGGVLSVDTGIETLTLSSTGGANATGTTTIGANSLILTGTENITLGGTITTAETITATAATGKVTLTSNNVNDTTITTGAGVDAITITGGSAVTETVSLGAGNDKVTFTANLADVDVLDGGEGTDTLVAIDANLAALTSTATTSNITNFEVVEVSDALSSAMDVSDIQEDGITTVNLANGSTTTLLTDDAFSITGEAGSLTVNLGKSFAGNVSDLDDTLTLVDSGTAVTDSATVNILSKNSTTNNSVDTLDGQDLTSTGYENLTISTGSGNANVEQTTGTITITPDATSADISLTVTGGNAIDIATAVSSSSTGKLTVDASGMTAQASGTTTFDLAAVSLGVGATVTVTGTSGDDNFSASGSTLGNFATTLNAGGGADAIFTGTANDTIKGEAGNDTINSGAGTDTVDAGAGDDTVIISADANLSALDSIAGGAGTDTLRLAADMTDAASTLSKVSGFEVLELAAGAADTITMSNFTNNQTFTRIDFADGGGNTLTANNVSDAVTDVRLITGAAGETVVFDRLSDGTANSLVVSSRADLDGTGADMVAFTANDEETITISGSTAANDVDLGALNAADLVTLNLSGAADIDVGTISSTILATIDASGSSGANAGSAAASTVALTYTGGSGVDTITTGTGNDVINGGLGDDVIVSGAGTDTINGGEGADNITGGDGKDAFTGGAGADTYNYTVTNLAAGHGADTISDFAVGTDIISVDVTTTGSLGAEVIVEITAQATTQASINDGDIVISGGSVVVDVSGAAAADLVALNAAISDADAMDAGGESLAVINADTDGNGNADEVQVWYIAGNATSDSAIETAYHIATLSDIAGTTDLTTMTGGDFLAANFDLV